MRPAEYRKKITQLSRLAYIQFFARLFVRVAWLMPAGWLFGWGTATLYGWFSEVFIWWELALVFGIFGLITTGWPRVSLPHFVWRIDRFFDTKEKFSAALEIQENNHDPLPMALLAELKPELDDLRDRFQKRGWYIRGDLISLVIVLVLVAMVNFFNISSVPAVADTPLLDLPVLASEPRFNNFLQVPEPEGELGNVRPDERIDFERLGGDDETLDLFVEFGDTSGYLQSTDVASGTGEVVSGFSTGDEVTGADAATDVYDEIYYPLDWEDRDVVSTYFTDK